MLNTCVRYLLNKINPHLSGKLLNAMLVLLLCQPTLQVHKPSRKTEDQTSDAQPRKKTQRAAGNY